jgi:RHS repeat-associated protein
MTSMLSLILAFMLTMGGSPAVSVGPVNPVNSIGAGVGGSRNITEKPRLGEISKIRQFEPIPMAEKPYILRLFRIKYEKSRLVDHYYYRNRYYLPRIGRFLQTDPMGYEDSMNMYQAFGMKAINFTDPFGEETWSKFLTSKKEFLKWRSSLGRSGEDSLELLKRVYLFRINQQNSFVDRIPGWGWHWLGGMFSMGEKIGDNINEKTNYISNPKNWGLITESLVSYGPRMGQNVQDEIYKGSSLMGAVFKTLGTELYHLTPIEEAKIFLDPNIPEDIRADATVNFGMKMGAYILAAEKMLGNRSASSIRKIRKKLSMAGFTKSEINSIIEAFDLSTIRYKTNLNFLGKRYRFFTSGQNPGGSWLTPDKSMINASLLMRKTRMALPKSNIATGQSWTRIYFGRKIITGKVAPQPSIFTGLPASIETGGINQIYVMPGKYLTFRIFL